MSSPVRAWLESQGLLVKAEFAAPWGVCDFVALSLRARQVRQRLRLRQRRPIGSLLRVALLHHIPDAESDGRRAVTLRCLERAVADFMDPQRLALELHRLALDHFVRFSRGDAVQKLNGWAPLHKRIVAVELKLDRVQEALSQARSHLRIADESFVALPGPIATRVAHGSRARLFESAGVGVLAVWRDGCTVALLPSRKRTGADPILQAHCVERFWRTAPPRH
jgi:hypothetical protein